MHKHLEIQLKNLPLSPGVYFFKDKNGVILYVGKAKKLRNRVRSYFNKSNTLSPSKKIMVRQIQTIDTILTTTESEALILESIHIKKHKPHFNVALKDDKHYNFVKINIAEEFPTVSTVRRPELDKGKAKARYFGPYTTGTNIHEHLRFLRRIFPYRKKDKPLTKFEQDLLHKRSLGPVPHTQEEYSQMIQKLIQVLEGHSDAVIKNLNTMMHTLSEEKNFEKAAAVRDQIQTLKHMQSRQKILSVQGESQDVISIYKQDDLAAVNVFIIRGGRLLDRLNFLLQHTQDENTTTLLDSFITQYYTDATNPPKEIILPARVNVTEDELQNIIQYNRHPELDSGSRIANTSKKQILNQVQDDVKGTHSIQFTIPNHGKKKELITLGEDNAKEYLTRSRASWEKTDEETTQALEDLQKALNLPHLPKRIEGYDISNIQGNMSVGSMVVFTNGTPDKNEYRKFKIKTITGPNDFASLAEVLKRRFSTSNTTKWKAPDLVLIDGGKGQLSTVLKAVDDTSGLQDIQFIGLAKREEEVFQGENLTKIALDPQSQASYLLQRIRDEAHRFAQKYYHSRHTKADVQSILDDIPGIGPKTKKQLIQAFGSVAGIRTADKNDIVKLIGKAKTETLLENI